MKIKTFCETQLDGISPRTLKAWAKAGKIRGISKPGRNYLIDTEVCLASVRAYLREKSAIPAFYHETDQIVSQILERM